jgi:hypothetical protein
VKIDEVIARVQRETGTADAADTRVPEHEVKLIVRATIRELGLEVARDGEVYNPAPPPAPAPSWEASWEAPRQRNVRHAGSRRRR